MQLRDYQIDIINKVRQLMRGGCHSILIQSPTGSGKTLLTASMLKTAQDRGHVCWFIVHRRELIKQSIIAFSQQGIEFGVIASGWPEKKKASIQIASIQTIARRLNKCEKEPTLIVYDECHHIAAGQWKKIYKRFENAYHIGLTATPQRLDGAGLKEFFSEMIEGPKVQWLIKNGFLSKYKMFAPKSVDTSAMHKRLGDFVTKEVEQAFDRPTITGDAIKHYIKLCNKKKAIVFCSSIKHSQHVIEQFKLAGISAAHIDGETNKYTRDLILNRFLKGDLDVISNVDLFGEGFDVPKLEAVILLRPTLSLGLYLQQVGRALRTCEGKEEAIILDHAGNVQRHGLPDEERNWSLEGNKVAYNKGEQTRNVKVCPKCNAVQESNELIACSFCGHNLSPKEREVQQVEGDLVELDIEKLRRERKIKQAQCSNKDELIQEGIRRGYKFPRKWAEYIWKARQKKKQVI